MIFVTVGTLQSLRSTARLTAAQSLVAACEEARSEAMRSGQPSLLAFKCAQEGGKRVCRSYGIARVRTVAGQTGEAQITEMQWFPLPQGISLTAYRPATISTGSDVLALPDKTAVDYGLPAMQTAPQEPAPAFPALVFGDLGEVTYPTAQAAAPGAPPTPGPYYIAVAEEEQTGRTQGPVNYQLIEIRPATGRALLLP